MHGYVPTKQGLVVVVKSRRKGNDGKTANRRAKGERRNGKTGPVALVYGPAGELIERLPEATFKDLSTKLRRRYNIHPTIHIAKNGKTEF
jgi:hypothetical protein